MKYKYADKELIEHVNEQIRRDEEDHRETLECLEIKKRMRIEEIVRDIAVKQGIILSDEEIGQIVQQIADEQGGAS